MIITNRRSPSLATPPVARARSLREFDLIETSYAPGYRGLEHRHPMPYFGSVIEGEFVETTRRGRLRYASGSLHVHPSDDPHAGHVGDRGARCFSIMLRNGLADRLESAAGARLAHVTSPLLASLADRCYRGFLARDSASDLACEAAALELVATVLRLQTPGESAAPAWLFAVRDYLHAHAAERVSLETLAVISGVHPVHLVRVFRRALGVTPAEYVRRVRLDQVCHALASTDRPLVEVALSAGYSSQAHFTRAFRTRFGTTPGAYRRARRCSA